MLFLFGKQELKCRMNSALLFEIMSLKYCLLLAGSLCHEVPFGIQKKDNKNCVFVAETESSTVK